MLLPNVVEYIKKSPEWQALQEHILIEANKLDSVEDIDFTTGDPALIKAQGRKEALETIKKILEPFFMGEQEPVDKASETKKRTGLED